MVSPTFHLSADDDSQRKITCNDHAGDAREGGEYVPSGINAEKDARNMQLSEGIIMKLSSLLEIMLRH